MFSYFLKAEREDEKRGEEDERERERNAINRRAKKSSRRWMFPQPHTCVCIKMADYIHTHTLAHAFKNS